MQAVRLAEAGGIEVRKLLGPNPFRAHDAIGAKGANFLTWSCLHHLTQQYGGVFTPAAALVELAGRSETGLLHVAGPERVNRHQLGLLALEAAGLSEDEARERVRAGTRADLGLEHRPADVSLDARRARALLRAPLRAPCERKQSVARCRWRPRLLGCGIGAHAVDA